MQVASDEAAKAVAKRERERLRDQERLKKQQLEKLRAEQNMSADDGAVGAGASQSVRFQCQCEAYVLTVRVYHAKN